MDNKEIEKLLIGIKDDNSLIVELEKYSINDIIDVALSKELYDSLLLIFKPITIDGVTKIYFDPFSTDILMKIDKQPSSIDELKEKYEEYVKYQFSPEDIKDFEEYKKDYNIMSKENKSKLLEGLFSIDFDLIRKIKIKDAKAREISGWGHPIKNVNDVIYYSEPACVQASIELFNKNIITTMNDTEGDNGSRMDEDGKCVIWIDYGLLSKKNQDVVSSLVSKGNAYRFMDKETDTVSIFVPCNGEETVGEVSDKLLNVVSLFQEQDFKKGRYKVFDFWEKRSGYYAKYFPSTFREYFEKEDFSWQNIVDFAQAVGYYFDPEEGIIWDCKEYYDKHKAYADKHKDDEKRHILINEKYIKLS